MKLCEAPGAAAPPANKLRQGKRRALVSRPNEWPALQQGPPLSIQGPFCAAAAPSSNSSALVFLCLNLSHFWFVL